MITRAKWTRVARCKVERDILRISETRVEGKTDKIKELVKKAISTHHSSDYHQRQGMLTGVGTEVSRTWIK